MFKFVAFAAISALALAGSSSDAKVYDGPSQPVAGQFARYRAAPRDGLLSIVPPDGAEFLKGQYFDARVELHNDGSVDAPDISGIKCTVNGQDMPAFFGGKWPETPETWNFTYFKDMNASITKQSTPVGVSSYVWRSLKLDNAGDYSFRCEAGSQLVYGNWHVRTFEGQGRLAKNVVLFVGDGMSPSMITAARVLSEPSWYGKYYQNLLSMESHGTTIGKVMTNGMDSIITDSANSASSYQNGHKGFVNALNVNGDTSADTLDDPKIETMAEILRRNRPNTCIGVVSTAEIQDATPASVFAHTRRRGDKAIITVQNLEQTFEQWTPPPAQVDVLFGGGGAYFCNGTSACRSLDGRDMYAEYSAKGYKLVTTTPELEQHVPKGEKVLGIFAANNLDTWIDRVLLNSNLGATNSSPLGEASTNYQQAGLELMVAKAIEIMDARCTDGWYLNVEAASIDKAMHPLDYQRGLADLLEMDRAVKIAKDYSAKNGDNTLVMITADHSQAYDVFGSVDTTLFAALPNEDPAGADGADGAQFQKKQAIGLYNTAGFVDSVVDPATGIPSRWSERFVLAQGKVDGPERSENFTLVTKPERSNPLARTPATEDRNLTAALGMRAYVRNPKDGLNGIDDHGNHAGSTSVHSLADVEIYCAGPGQGACGRTMDNTEVFFIIAQAFGL